MERGFFFFLAGAPTKPMYGGGTRACSRRKEDRVLGVCGDSASGDGCGLLHVRNDFSDSVHPSRRRLERKLRLELCKTQLKRGWRLLEQSARSIDHFSAHSLDEIIGPPRSSLPLARALLTTTGPFLLSAGPPGGGLGGGGGGGGELVFRGGRAALFRLLRRAFASAAPGHSHPKGTAANSRRRLTNFCYQQRRRCAGGTARRKEGKSAHSSFARKTRGRGSMASVFSSAKAEPRGERTKNEKKRINDRSSQTDGRYSLRGLRRRRHGPRAHCRSPRRDPGNENLRALRSPFLAPLVAAPAMWTDEAAIETFDLFSEQRPPRVILEPIQTRICSGSSRRKTLGFLQS